MINGSIFENMIFIFASLWVRLHKGREKFKSPETEYRVRIWTLSLGLVVPMFHLLWQNTKQKRCFHIFFVVPELIGIRVLLKTRWQRILSYFLFVFVFFPESTTLLHNWNNEKKIKNVLKILGTGNKYWKSIQIDVFL